MVLGKEVAIFDWEWGRNSAPRDGQKSPCVLNISIIREYQTPSYIKVDRPIDMFPYMERDVSDRRR